MKRALLVALLSGPAFLVACGHTFTDHVATHSTRPARSSRDVQLVLEDAPIPTGFAEIGLVQARGDGDQAGEDSVLRALEREARRMGASAVVRIHIDRRDGDLAAIGIAGVIDGPR